MLADIKGPHRDFFGGPNSLSHGSECAATNLIKPKVVKETQQWRSERLTQE